MKILGGVTVEVWRAPVARDRFGDVERVLIGTIEHCVFQWASAASVGLRWKANTSFRETSELGAVLFAPRDHPIQISGRDRLKMQGTTYQVIGQKAWDETNPATGYDFGHYMVQLEAVE
jgi:hypothetical protein